MHKSKRGLRLPIQGEPTQQVEAARTSTRVALLGADYPGLRPTMHVKVGETVKRGQLLFEDKKMPGVRFTSAGAGKVVAVNRGEKRVFQSMVIELTRGEIEGRAGSAEQVAFGSFTGKHPASLTGDQVKALLIESGLWTAFRGRPFARVADPEAQPHSIFVTAIDSNPLAPSVEVAMVDQGHRFQLGLAAIAKLTEGKVFVCTARGVKLDLPDESRIQVEQFSGPHPAGTVGYHIHTLDPVDRNKVVWYLGYQDVTAIGELFDSGELYLNRVISLAGPIVRQPRLLRTRIGVSTDSLVEGELGAGEPRVISGSALSGRIAQGDALGYLGRYDNQITVLAEGREREFLGWLTPGSEKHSVVKTHLGALIPGKRFAYTTATHGSQRAIVPIGSYERVMPFDLMPTQLLKTLLMRDVEVAERLGCLELAEEDVAVCSYVCPGKNDYGPYLRDVLTLIEKEG
ncbi:MAG: Na(+)-translocating NADH-quinone reductase subunit A [Thermoanaerobaculia bacterium]